MSGKLNYPKVILDQMIKRYENGLSLQRIATEFGFAVSTVRRSLMDEGTRMRERYTKHEPGPLPLEFSDFRPALNRDGVHYAGYYVSSDGRVVSTNWPASLTILCGVMSNAGYFRVGLHSDGGLIGTECIHQLVARAWIGMPTISDPQVNHKDGNKQNNDHHNLEWTTRKGNGEHASEMGLMPRGTGHVNAKLTEAKVQEIRQLYDGGCSPGALADRFYVSRTNVRLIVSRKAWRHVA